jgi:hypothetical protein
MIVVGIPGKTVVIVDKTVIGGSVIVAGGMTIVSPGIVRIVVTVDGSRVINRVVPETIVVNVVGWSVTTNVDGSGAGRVSTEVVKLPDSVVVIVDGSRVIKTSVVVTDTDIAVVMEIDVSVVYRMV